MERRDIIKHSERLTFWVIILSIVGLVLISLLPWISVTESDGINDNLIFNLEMMSKSNNLAIKNIANQLNLVNVLLWTLIILGIVSLIGATIYSSGKYSLLGQILLMVGCVMIVSGIFVLHVQLSIYNIIEKNLIITSADVFPHIKYSFILLLISIIIFIFSAVYVVLIILHLAERIKELIKESKENNNIIYHTEKLSIEPEKEEDGSEIEKLLSEKLKNKKKQEDKTTINEQENNNKIEGTFKSPFKDEKTPQTKMEELKKEGKIEHKTLEKPDISPKEKDIEKIPSDLKNEQKGIPITVRCPQCKYVFPIEKKRNEIKIECPKCGKTGTIKS